MTYQDTEHTYARRGLTPLPIPHITGMKLQEDVALGSLVLNKLDTSTGLVWVCTDINGWWEPPQAQFPNNDKAFGDGAYQVTGRYLPRELTLEGSILCPDPSYTPDARAALVEAIDLVYAGAWLRATERQQGTATISITGAVAADGVITFTTGSTHSYAVGEVVYVTKTGNSDFNGLHSIFEVDSTSFKTYNPISNATLTGLSATVRLGEIIKASYVRVSGQPNIRNVKARGRIDFSVGLQAADPIKYHWVGDRTANFENVMFTPVADSNTQTLINNGDYPVGIKISVTGPVIGPMIIRNTTNDQTLKIVGSLTDAKTLEVRRAMLVDDVATLTTVDPHNFSVGMEVTVASIGSPFDGTYTITDIPNEQEFSYARSYSVSSPINQYTQGKQAAITSGSVSGGYLTIITSTPHGFVEGAEVVISGTSQSVYNDRFTIFEIVNDTRFRVKTSSSLSTTGGTATVPGLITLRYTADDPFSAGNLITVASVSPSVNTIDTEIVSVNTTANTFVYYAPREREVRWLSFNPTSDDDTKDVVTLFTWDPHGYSVGDTIYVSGCGRPINVGTSEITATISSVDNKTNAMSFKIDSFTRTISDITVEKSTNGYYKVTVTCSSAHSFANGDQVDMTAALKGSTTKPPGINGVFSIHKVVGSSTKFYYQVRPKSTKRPELIRFFGVASGSVDLKSTSNVELATISKKLITTNGMVFSAGITGATTIDSKAVVQTIADHRLATAGSASVTRDSMTIDTGLRTVTLNADTEYARGKVAAVTDWIKLDPGANNITVRDMGAEISSSEVTIKYRSGWIA